MSEVGWGAILGLGLWALMDGGVRHGLASRIAPYVRDVSVGARETANRQGIADLVTMVSPHPIRFVVTLWAGRRSVHRANIDSELPSILDRFAVCLGAGLSIPDTFAHVGADSIGILGIEARAIARDIEVGVPLVDACNASEQRVRHESWSRLLDHLLGARRHGTPIADIVRSLAADERAAAGRRLLEAASSREIYMLLPLVFVILPMTVMVAVFPGLVALGSLPV